MWENKGMEMKPPREWEKLNLEPKWRPTRTLDLENEYCACAATARPAAQLQLEPDPKRSRAPMQRPPAASQPRRRKLNSRSRHNAVLTLPKYNSHFADCSYNSPWQSHIPSGAGGEGQGPEFLPTQPSRAAVPDAAVSAVRSTPPPPQIQKQTRFSPARAGAVMQIGGGGAPRAHWVLRPLCHRPMDARGAYSPCKSPGFLFEWGTLATPPALKMRTKCAVVALPAFLSLPEVIFFFRLAPPPHTHTPPRYFFAWRFLSEHPPWNLREEVGECLKSRFSTKSRILE